MTASQPTLSRFVRGLIHSLATQPWTEGPYYDDGGHLVWYHPNRLTSSVCIWRKHGDSLGVLVRDAWAVLTPSEQLAIQARLDETVEPRKVAAAEAAKREQAQRWAAVQDAIQQIEALVDP